MINQYKMRDLEIRYIDENLGYGVFTNEFIKKGETIEISHCIEVKVDTCPEYSFELPNKKVVIPLGYGSIYNHSDEYNILWKPLDEKHVQFYSIKDIEPNSQLCHNYGKNYWKFKFIEKI